MDLRRLTTLLLLLGAAVASFYLSQSLEEDGEQPRTAPSRQGGFYLRAARILGTGPDGQLLYEVEAEYAEQRDDATVEFENVSVVYAPETGIPWRMQADSATVAENQELLQLRGHVIARTSEGPNGDETEIRTAYLELEPSKYLAQTTERVQIRIGARSLTATGMLASLNEDRLTLQSNVSGKFVP